MYEKEAKEIKNIIFTIKTSYSEEQVFLSLNEVKPVELQLANALAKYSFCEDYKIKEMEAVTEKYLHERGELIEKYKKHGIDVEDYFMFGLLVTNKALKSAKNFG